MRNHRIIVATLLLCACNKSEEWIPRSDEHCYYSALLEGAGFEGIIRALRTGDSTTGFSINRYFPNGEEEMGVAFYIPGWQTGEYPLYPGIYDSVTGVALVSPNAHLFTVQGGDAGCGEWTVSVTDSATNRLFIDTASGKVLAGRFKVTFRKVRDCEARHYPDTLRFTQGRFHLEF